jgi:hypothetical protein
MCAGATCGAYLSQKCSFISSFLTSVESLHSIRMPHSVV